MSAPRPFQAPPLVSFPDVAAHDDATAALGRSAGWRDRLAPLLASRRYPAAAIERRRLVPAARSLLRG